ncbi:hypothetical protein LTR41_011299 [Exophiala xenobiotica]|nr:hypothetical protein LTR41_011299 [Exophiala xenobiotica]KAK5550192.1 hypothetical protein LTR46_011803 [Exophiala xenobiotica]
MAIADNALFGYESLEDVRAQEIPSGKDELELRFKDRPWDGRFFGNARKPAHLTQADEQVFGQSYVANCSSVDGQAAFRGEKSDQRHIEYFQSMEKFHEEGLPDKLPSHLEDDIYRDPELRELEKEMQTLAQTGGGSKARSQPKQRCANRLKELKNQALRQYQEHWIRERRDWKILTRGKEAAPDKSKTDFVQSLCLLIPERGRLAQKMAADHALEPTEMWKTMQDLYTLCMQDFTLLYLPKSRPVDGACPVKCCQLRMDSEPGLPASQQLKPWSRDHKLWCHIDDEHLVDRRWPPVCHLCDVPLKDAAALQCHFADGHGLSRTRPVKPAHSAALGSQDEKMLLDKEAPSALPSRKRKSSSDTTPVEWMPPQSFDGAPASPAKPSPCLPRKRPRHTPPAICPMVLSLDEAFSADQSAYNVKSPL